MPSIRITVTEEMHQLAESVWNKMDRCKVCDIAQALVAAGCEDPRVGFSTASFISPTGQVSIVRNMPAAVQNFIDAVDNRIPVSLPATFDLRYEEVL